MSDEQVRATVSIRTRALWRIRLAHELPRYVLYAVSLAGLAASVRFAIAPPTPALPVAAEHQPAAPDPAAEAYAVLFARRYLTWNAGEPQANVHALEPFLGPGMETAAGLQLPANGEQHVEWAEVVQARTPAPGEQVYTVAAQTDTAGLLYLTVPVAQTLAGGLALAGYPAFVGAPAAEPAQLPAHVREVSNPELATVVQRALRNYLAASSSELAADLSSGARVSLPSQPLTLESVQRLDWAQEGSAVVATVQAQDGRGVRYALAYELDVLHEQGRWEISAVQTDPDA
ncbi:MAG TPA: conjugal transfer protein [Solirubrobacteraceae bacterium]|nr:conjugal transfer protein [Solirubrobacteraceae bacterium]